MSVCAWCRQEEVSQFYQWRRKLAAHGWLQGRRCRIGPQRKKTTNLNGRGKSSTSSARPLGQGLNYLRNHWGQLEAYTQDGRVPIDNNGTECNARPVAVGRNNWLFFQSVRGAKGRGGIDDGDPLRSTELA